MNKIFIALTLLCLTHNAQSMFKKPKNYSVQIHQTKATKISTTQLHQAAEKGDIKKIENLLPHYANIDIQDDTGKTPLFVAIQHNKKEAAELFIKRGANINKQTTVGTTSLIQAIKNESLECTMLLLENGANPTIGRTKTPESFLVEFYGATPPDEKITENFKFMVPVHSYLLHRRLNLLYWQQQKDEPQTTKNLEFKEDK